MSEPEPLSVDDALERLVNQFSDPMAFFRELIQNALDAGSEEVEVWFERRPKEGLMVIHVDDWGGGMTREIIETRLTRLFSSSKDGDLTKIGKFGIGFVSVFAIAPEAVVIDTSREGEHWRILFDSQRQFSLIKRDEPVEGTKIEIYKRADAREYAKFVARATEVIGFWCKHVSKEIRVEGELVNQPFDLDVPCKVRYEHEGELIVVGHTRDGEAFSGFYNRGLTLAEEGLIPGIAFKASSAKLEHTLTRDDVVREAGFERLMAQVQELIATELCAEVFARLARELGTLEVGATREAIAEHRYLWRAATHHLAAKHPLPESVGKDPPIFVSPSGATIGLAELRKPKRRRVFVAHAGSPVSALLEGEGATVVWLPERTMSGLALLEQVAPKVEWVSRWCTAMPARDPEEATRWRTLSTHVAALLEGWGAKLGGVALGHLDYAHSAVADRVAITQAEFGELTPVEDAGELGTRLFSSRRIVVLNADHPTIKTLGELAMREPEMAAYLAVKAFFLGNRLDAEVDETLVGLTHERRARRRELSEAKA